MMHHSTPRKVTEYSKKDRPIEHNIIRDDIMLFLLTDGFDPFHCQTLQSRNHEQ